MNTQGKVQLDHEQVGALMDGRLDGDAFEAVMHAMSSDEGLECWQTYHVIGDVLRSADLAACGRDPAFMERLSAELAEHPRSLPTLMEDSVQAASVLTDMSKPAANDNVFRWKVAAGLASFAAVAAMGWGVLGGIGASGDGAGQLAQSQSLATNTNVVSLKDASVALEAGSEHVPVMLRDPHLDEFLAAHRQAAGVSALGDASGFLRNATFEGSGR